MKIAKNKFRQIVEKELIKLLNEEVHPAFKGPMDAELKSKLAKEVGFSGAPGDTIKAMEIMLQHHRGEHGPAQPAPTVPAKTTIPTPPPVVSPRTAPRKVRPEIDIPTTRPGRPIDITSPKPAPAVPVIPDVATAPVKIDPRTGIDVAAGRPRRTKIEPAPKIKVAIKPIPPVKKSIRDDLGQVTKEADEYFKKLDAQYKESGFTQKQFVNLANRSFKTTKRKLHKSYTSGSEYARWVGSAKDPGLLDSENFPIKFKNQKDKLDFYHAFIMPRIDIALGVKTGIEGAYDRSKYHMHTIAWPVGLNVVTKFDPRLIKDFEEIAAGSNKLATHSWDKKARQNVVDIFPTSFLADATKRVFLSGPKKGRPCSAAAAATSDCKLVLDNKKLLNNIKHTFSHEVLGHKIDDTIGAELIRYLKQEKILPKKWADLMKKDEGPGQYGSYLLSWLQEPMMRKVLKPMSKKDSDDEYEKYIRTAKEMRARFKAIAGEKNDWTEKEIKNLCDTNQSIVRMGGKPREDLWWRLDCNKSKDIKNILNTLAADTRRKKLQKQVGREQVYVENLNKLEQIIKETIYNKGGDKHS